MVTPGLRRRLLSSTYECGGRASREHLSDVPLAVYEVKPPTEEVARMVAGLQTVSDSSSFYVMDPQAVEDRLTEWRDHLPFTRPFYSLRCNDDALLLQLLTRARDCNLHVSSLAELETARALVPASRIVFHAPLLTRKTMRCLAALEDPLAFVVVDDAETAEDMGALAPSQPLLLRVTLSPDDDVVELALGTPIDDALEAIPQLLQMDVPLAGVSVQLLTPGGSDCEMERRANDLIEMLKALSPCDLRVLDVGGGFRSRQLFDVSQLLECILASCQQPNLKLIASPGRFFATSAFSLVTSIIGKREMDAGYITRDVADAGCRGFVYETNESFYGAFGGTQLGEKMACEPLLLGCGDEEARAGLHASAILGTARDCFDVPQRLAHLPSMAVGDCLLWKDMGAYSSREEDGVSVYYFVDRNHWERLKRGEERRDSDGLLSDGGSDGDTETDVDEDDMAECFGRVFTH